MSTDVVDSARFLCVAAAGAPSTLALLAAASPLLPPALAASVLPALGPCCSAPAPAAGSTPRVFDLSLRPPPTVLALVVSALSPAWGVVAPVRVSFNFTARAPALSNLLVLEYR